MLPKLLLPPIPKPPRILVIATVIATTFALLPPAIAARMRAEKSREPRIHLIQNMDNQARWKAQQANPLFADGRAMRPNIEGTVARGELRTDGHLERGRVIKDGAEVWADTVPTGLEVTEDFVRRGQERFNIFCAPCHGWSGLGDGPIHRRAQSLVDGSPTLSYGTVWVQPKNLHEQIYIDQPIGQIYATITLGARSMAGYKAQIPVEDRWAIAAYVKALQSSETVAETMIETVAAPAEEN